MAKLAVEGVVNALRTMILDGQYAPGDRLDEITLVDRHAPEISTFEAQRPAWLPSAG